MRENGFLDSTWSGATAADVLATKKMRDVIFALPNEVLPRVVEKMKQHDVSQIPVVDESGHLLGLTSEVDLLNHMVLSDHKAHAHEPIADLMQKDPVTVTPDASIESLMGLFVNRGAVVVTEQGRVTGILTKIDLLDYLASRS
jgi:cystathionine beta-synthase